ncbi:hypothetical protein VD0004_g3182 [Verticillium dahliae]|nr:hypothetical protein VD0004_g3182 [Verticillium dahliae]PNH74787.1 hypothetical protein VD0001_g2738 [Verticillium dahliae]
MFFNVHVRESSRNDDRRRIGERAASEEHRNTFHCYSSKRADSSSSRRLAVPAPGRRITPRSRKQVQEKPVPGLVTRLVEEDFEEFDARTLQTSFHIVGLADVEVPYDDPADIFSIIPQRVLVHGQFIFYKSSVSTEGTRNEIGKYDKIAASGLSSSELPTSRLCAMVVGSKGRLHGMIYHFIKSEERLTWAVDERAALALREKWAAQIKDTVAKLHHLSVVWGDVKADNVLVDENGNAIVIDLEGGTTQGWVDREKEGTVEGDAQGVENMMDFIFDDESMLRPPPLGPDDEPIVKLRGY